MNKFTRILKSVLKMLKGMIQYPDLWKEFIFYLTSCVWAMRAKEMIDSTGSLVYYSKPIPRDYIESFLDAMNTEHLDVMLWSTIQGKRNAPFKAYVGNKVTPMSLCSIPLALDSDPNA